MTNTEIEDVLSSIRRLVAQESRPAPSAAPGRLILTAEHRVAQGSIGLVGQPEPPATARPEGATAVRPSGLAPVAPVFEVAPPNEVAPDVRSPDATVSDTVAPDRAATPAATPVAPPVPALDRAGIEAALSEIEAALPPLAARAVAETGRHAEAPPAALDEAGSDEPDDGDLPLIDEAELQLLIARLVRKELHGQLGEKITLQVRKLVRAEIARALDERRLVG